MRLLYIIDKDVMLANRHETSHNFIDLPVRNKVLASVEFGSDSHQSRFEMTASAEPVAHNEPVSERHQQMLSHLGVQPGHSHKQIRNLAKKVYRLM